MNFNQAQQAQYFEDRSQGRVVGGLRDEYQDRCLNVSNSLAPGAVPHVMSAVEGLKKAAGEFDALANVICGGLPPTGEKCGPTSDGLAGALDAAADDIHRVEASIAANVARIRSRLVG